MELVESKRILQQLCSEVSDMNDDGRHWLTSLWRNRYGYSDALPSVEEMAIELAIQRGIKIY